MSAVFFGRGLLTGASFFFGVERDPSATVFGSSKFFLGAGISSSSDTKGGVAVLALGEDTGLMEVGVGAAWKAALPGIAAGAAGAEGG